MSSIFACAAGCLSVGGNGHCGALNTLVLSVVLYVVIPLVAGVLTRRVLRQPDTTARLDALLTKLKPYSMVGLLATLLLFASGTI